MGPGTWECQPEFSIGENCHHDAPRTVTTRKMAILWHDTYGSPVGLVFPESSHSHENSPYNWPSIRAVQPKIPTGFSLVVPGRGTLGRHETKAQLGPKAQTDIQADEPISKRLAVRLSRPLIGTGVASHHRSTALAPPVALRRPGPPRLAGGENTEDAAG